MLFWDGELAGFMAMKNEVECNNDDNNEEKHVVIIPRNREKFSDFVKREFGLNIMLDEETKKIWYEMELEERRMQQAQSSEKAARPHE